MPTTSHADYAKPKGLSADGNKAYAAIIAFLKKNDMTYTGGCKAFFSPQEWAERGEEYGLTSELIVVHDGGDLASIFNLDYGNYKLYDRMVKHLDKSDVWSEGCTCWYTAIYSSND